MLASWRELRAGFTADGPGGGGSRSFWTIGAQRGAVAGDCGGIQTVVVEMEAVEQA